MKRGDLVAVALSGDFGKPRPALIIQADQFSSGSTMTVVLITGTLVDAPLIRLSLSPTPENGLQKASQVMIDKVMTVKSVKLGKPFGMLSDVDMIAVNRALALFLGFA